MAKCKLCKKLINDGTEYCTDCADKKDLIANESYLDDLLNSVQNKATTASDIFKKKKEDQISYSSDTIMQSKKASSSFVDPGDLSDFDRYDYMKEFADPIVISNEDLYGDVATSTESYIDEEEQKATLSQINEEGQKDTLNQINEEEQRDTIGQINEEEQKDTLSQIDEEEKDISSQIDEEEQDMSSQNIDSEFLEMNESDEQINKEDEHIEPILDDLLKHLDLTDNNEDDNDIIQDSMDSFEGPEETAEIDEALLEENESGQVYENERISADEPENEYAYENELESTTDITSETENAPENELMDLLNQFNPDNPVEDDIKAISDLLGGISTQNQPVNVYPEDVGDVFSEALEAVSDLGGPDQGIKHIAQEPVLSDKKRDSKEKKEKKASLFSKLFSNVNDDELSPEEKKAQDELTAAKEAKRKKKKLKGKKEQTADKEESEELSAKRRQDEAPAEVKKKEKKPKRERKKKIEILDDEVDEGRINKTGASIIFLFFGILVTLLLILTNIFSYSLSIKNATDYFGRQRYTQAYNEVYGIELKDEDIELYDKIMTVMFVNKQLNSYNNYYHMRKFPEALDSLLKGLQRYDKYVELATMLGIKTDLDYVRNQIIAELYNVFSLNEEQAMRIINSESQVQYSIAVYDVILENISFYN